MEILNSLHFKDTFYWMCLHLTFAFKNNKMFGTKMYPTVIYLPALSDYILCILVLVLYVNTTQCLSLYDGFDIFDALECC